LRSKRPAPITFTASASINCCNAPAGELADQVSARTDAKRVEQVRNGRLFPSHR
jgi:hypothetical protein